MVKYNLNIILSIAVIGLLVIVSDYLTSNDYS